ncbi:MAG: hypothetical protein R2844_21515 [Caldilineales bacterium]
MCHKDAGTDHQAGYDELYQDGVIQVTDLAYSFSGPDASTVTFNMTKDGAPFDAREADNLAIYFTPYADGKFQFDPALERLSLKGDLTYDGQGGITSVITGTEDFTDVPGIVVVYGRDETVGSLPARVAAQQVPVCSGTGNGRRR